jgi:hypothetical protein
MYLGGVNRGVSFTKAGFYTTGLVLLLGFIATGSNQNGLLLALGFGLSFLIISGLLSEKTIRAIELENVSDTTAEANQPFTVQFRVTNSNSSWFIFGLETLVTTELPKFKLLQSKVDALIEGRLLVLPPGQTLSTPGKCSGLGRGWYRDFFIIQRTLFPFGMLSKFKVGKIRADISVLPAVDPAFETLFDEDLRNRLSGLPEAHEFHSHQKITPFTPLHAIDWKKNASRPVDDWVMKTFESPLSDFALWVDPDWEEIRLLSKESDYERMLSILRTALEGLRRTGKTFCMTTPSGHFVFGWQETISILVRAPKFDARNELGKTQEGTQAKPGAYLRLRISVNGHEWERSQLAS